MEDKAFILDVCVSDTGTNWDAEFDGEDGTRVDQDAQWYLDSQEAQNRHFHLQTE